MNFSDPLNSVAVFVMSCDKTMDVARHFVGAFKKNWPDCPYPIYFGVNSTISHIGTLEAVPLYSSAKGWRLETLEQLNLIREFSPSVTHLLVFLDDFILTEKVDTHAIQATLAAAVDENVGYLRLRRLDGSFWELLRQRLLSLRSFSRRRYFAIRRSHPYHSALQVALWRYEHIYASVDRTSDIWKFEQQVDSKTPHYSVPKSLISYKHIVEKGKWDIGAEECCENVLGWFEPGNRPHVALSPYQHLMLALKRAIFPIFGYFPMRLKRQLRCIGILSKER